MVAARRVRCEHELMTSRMPFYFVDVFATRPLTGNPLSLVPDADDLDEAQMPAATVRLRSVTPAGVEVGGAGHNALGAWLWLESAGRLTAAAEDGGLRQEITGEVLPVEVVRTAGQPAMVWMDQSPPRFGAAAGRPRRAGRLPGPGRAGSAAG